MTADFIRHPERIRQVIDFSSFCVRSSDVDWETEITSDIVVRGEAKFRNAPLSRGQSMAAHNWVDRMGLTTHAFYVLATHDVPSSQPIMAQDLVIKAVVFRLPGMPDVVTCFYDEGHRPSVNMFLGSLVKCYRQFAYWNDLAELDPVWFFDPVLCAAYDSSLARQHREKSRAALENLLNQNTTYGPWVLPADLRTSEQHRMDFLSWHRRPGVTEPMGWAFYQECGEPSHLLY